MNIQKVSASFTILSVLFSFYGLVKMAWYYSLFIPNIPQLISFQDIFLASMEGVMNGWLLLLALFSIMGLTIDSETFNQPSFWTFLWKNKLFSVFLSIILIVFTTLIINSISNLNNWYHEYEPTTFCIIILIIAVFLPISINKMSLFFNFSLISHGQRVLLFVILIMPLYYVIEANYEIERVLTEKMYKDTKVYLKSGETLKSNPMNFYIGNTENYLFYLHLNDTDTLLYTSIIPMSEVKTIDIKYGYH